MTDRGVNPLPVLKNHLELLVEERNGVLTKNSKTLDFSALSGLSVGTRLLFAGRRRTSFTADCRVL